MRTEDAVPRLTSRLTRRPGLRILHSISSVNPESGGPIEGIKQLSRPLRELGCEVEVVSSDSPGASFIREFPVPIYALGPSKLPLNYNFIPRLTGWMRNHASNYDLVVINGLWQFSSFGAWLGLRRTKTPYFVFPHGMLDPWFKQTYPLKHLKKWLYWPWAEYQVLRHASAVVFTCEQERILARESFWLYRVRERVVHYGTADPTVPSNAKALFEKSFPMVQGRRVLLFLGRIHEKKGCDMLIEAFARVSEHSRDLVLVMAGPDPSKWELTLRQRASELGIAERVCWPGPLFGDLKWGAFACAEAFILPSHQENFGISVAEALACGVPVLVSNKVNIYEEIVSAGAGFAEEDTVAGTVRLLLKWLGATRGEWAEKGTKARQLFLSQFEIRAMARSFLEIYEDVVGTERASQPQPG